MMKILYVTHTCYLDDSNGAAVASRALMKALARDGSLVEVVCGAMLNTNDGVDPARWLASRGHDSREYLLAPSRSGHPGHGGTRFLSLTNDGIPVSIHVGYPTVLHHPSPEETDGFLRLLGAVIGAFGPDFVVGYGGSAISLGTFSLAKNHNIHTIFLLYNFSYDNMYPFSNVDVVVVPSECSANYYYRTLGMRCRVIPCTVEPSRFVAIGADRPRDYVLFVNPSYKKCVYVFVRIAHELGRMRPDIKFLVIEGRGTESTLVNCGLDLLEFGNVFLMDHPRDPKEFWAVSKICLMPSLWWESQGLVAVEAMSNGVPVLASDRGALPETIGRGGFVLPLPDRLTANTRELPTVDEVGPWIETILRLWDDDSYYRSASDAALLESRDWTGDRSLRLFTGVMAELMSK
jgi:glycosyltransferase involved in cell wall biosynthesis